MNHAGAESSAAPAELGERVARIVFRLIPVSPALILAVGAWRRRWMDDDGFINLRVVRNLLHGHGAVFNLGERVEVCTSPLWTAILALAGALGAPLERTAVCLGIMLAIAALVLGALAAGEFQKGTAQATDAVDWPVGIGIFAVLPPAWDYASSGLETGLTLAWLGGSYLALGRLLARKHLSPGTGDTLAAAALFGVGPLIRPELALYTAAWFLPFFLRLATEGRNRPWRAARSLARLAAASVALPLAYELFRMGYYGTVTPNTAIAKEAFRTNWDQGLHYFHNFFGLYAMAWPAAAAALFLGARLAALRATRDFVGGVAAITPVAAALVHVVYIVAIGGDYMHGRMFLPPVFAALLPVAVVRLQVGQRWVRAALAGAGAIVAIWMGVCGVKLRAAQENDHDIGDERGWYAREADVATPVTLADYRKHQFYKAAQKALVKIELACGSIDRDDPKEGEACRALYFDDDAREQDIGKLAPQRPTYPLAADVDPRVGLAVPMGAIGIFGYLMPDAVHVIDRHGLAEPLASHLELGAYRGRPGHEKRMSDPWLLARYAAPVVPDDARVTAARRALGCGELRGLVLAATAPLTWGRFADNVAHAFAYSRLRIPPDAFEAEARFCGVSPLPVVAAGGTGGDRFHWRCPDGTRVVAMRGEVSDADNALARVQPICAREATSAEWGDAAEIVGAPFGREASEAHGAVTPFEVRCPAGTVATGLAGKKGNLVEALGLVCGSPDADAAARTSSSTAGSATGTPFRVDCEPGTYAVGIAGRAGALLDQVGIVCGH